MNKPCTTILVFFVALLGLNEPSMAQTTPPKPPAQERLVALGDSYTIGEGVSAEERWPNQLVQLLNERGISIALSSNPARSGWTTEEVLTRELSVIDEAHPTLATLLIGVNDCVRGVPEELFRSRLQKIIEQIQKKLPSPQRLLLVTIPDFSVTPAGARFGNPAAIAKSLIRFNRIIAEEGKRASAPVIDIFTKSQIAGTDTSYLVSDGLHPSRKQYTLWVEAILPVALQVLRDVK